MPNLDKAYQWAIQKCNDPKVGYSQTYRRQVTVRGITYYDCSSFIWYALKAGGWDVQSVTGSYPFRTIGMPNYLPRLGFTQVDILGEWKAGDIVLRTEGQVPSAPVGHTEMVYSGGNAQGITMGAHTNNNRQLADQVSINTTPSYPYTVNSLRSYKTLWRYGNGGAEDGGYNVSLYVLSAIAGNWWQESNINPGLFEGRRWLDLLTSTEYGGYGLGQWTRSRDGTWDRRTPLARWLVDNGYALDSPDGQIKYFIKEAYWTQAGWASDFASLDEFLASGSTDLEYLTKAFYRGWEGGSSENSASERYAHAQQVYNYLVLHAGESATWIISNDYLSTPDILNNALALFNAFQASSGAPTERRRKLPLWMYLRPIRYY